MEIIERLIRVGANMGLPNTAIVGYGNGTLGRNPFHGTDFLRAVAQHASVTFWSSMRGLIPISAMALVFGQFTPPAGSRRGVLRRRDDHRRLDRLRHWETIEQPPLGAIRPQHIEDRVDDPAQLCCARVFALRMGLGSNSVSTACWSHAPPGPPKQTFHSHAETTPELLKFDQYGSSSMRHRHVMQ